VAQQQKLDDHQRALGEDLCDLKLKQLKNGGIVNVLFSISVAVKIFV